ncbi:DUF4386 domain-containing protein [Paenibacillus sp. NFR01]|uniref:DUF4386 domain-containing protein n=1 Tax=Paenibacillus sp. NFR01 TaxID=1566279 RepID=UPI0008D297D3|nr:DUF4386 domain-containing protein [Paenibacillus sp. NFR01]SES99261.1 protein of unknown function [Paenibacillus sp. NFR01]
MNVQKMPELRKYALTAGVALMLMTAAAAFAYGYAHASFIVQGDAEATFGNLLSHSNRFKAEIFGWMVIMVCDIVAAWACYLLMKPVHPQLSLLGAWLRLIYSGILGVAIAMLLLVLQTVNQRGDVASIFTDEQLAANAMLHMTAFDAVWSMGLIVFAGHLLILGVLTLRADRMPKWIGILLLLGALGYFLIHVVKLFFADAEGVAKILEIVFMIPMTAGEEGFGLWMLFRGGKAAS